MKAFLIILIMMAGLYNQVQAQQFIERVYLKDSSFHEGFIIEQVPQQYLKIDRLKQKDTVIVPMTLIWKITKAYRTDTVATKTAAKPAGAEKQRYLITPYFELGGSGLIYSFNYDMRTEKGRRNGWGFRLGFTTLSIRATDKGSGSIDRISYTGIPFGINYLFGKRKGFLELGMGATYQVASANGSVLSAGEIDNYEFDAFGLKAATIIGTFNIGYRHVPYKSGIMYRFTFTPLVVGNVLATTLGISIGYKF